MARLNCNDTNNNLSKNVSNPVMGESSSYQNKKIKEYRGIISIADNLFKEVYISVHTFLSRIFKKIITNAKFLFKKYKLNVNTSVVKSLDKLKKAYINFKNSFDPSSKEFKKKVFIYSVSAASSLIIISSCATISNYKIALSVDYNGQNIGYINNHNVLNQALADIQDKLLYKDGVMDNIPTNTSNLVITEKDNILSAEKLSEKILSLSNDKITFAYGLYIDNEFYGATIQKESITSALNNFAYKYVKTEIQDILDISFVENVEIKEGFFLNHNIVSEESINNIISNNSINYESNNSINITPTNLSNKSYLDFDPSYYSKDNILNVKITQKEYYFKDIPFSTTVNYDDNYFKNYEKIIVNGENGVDKLTDTVSYINGIEVSRQNIEVKNVKSPIDKVVLKGNANYNAIYSRSVKPNGFIWPVDGGYISDHYGSRKGSHLATDIAAPYGTSVFASAQGTVISAGWSGGYGKYIVIDHGNGVKTAYGHNSSLLVSVGDYVSQGQPIAKVGSTGYSTGNHVHFEIFINGRAVNPVNYIGNLP